MRSVCVIFSYGYMKRKQDLNHLKGQHLYVYKMVVTHCAIGMQGKYCISKLKETTHHNEGMKHQGKFACCPPRLLIGHRSTQPHAG